MIEAINSVATSSKDTVLGNLFVDEIYNRSNFTLLGDCPEALGKAVLDVSRFAITTIDLRSHSATHPRLGVVDHISCHPLTCPELSMPAAVAAAHAIACNMGLGNEAVPTFLYGHAHPEGRHLADIRRAFGYFSPSKVISESSQAWAGPLEEWQVDGLLPDFGPQQVDPRRGVTCVGACPWIINFNILLDTDNLKVCKLIARSVSRRGGGLQGVEAMALKHADGIEIACNLLSPDIVTPEMVENKISDLCRNAEGINVSILRSYTTGKSIDDLLRAFANNDN